MLIPRWELCSIVEGKEAFLDFHVFAWFLPAFISLISGPGHAVHVPVHVCVPGWREDGRCEFALTPFVVSHAAVLEVQ